MAMSQPLHNQGRSGDRSPRCGVCLEVYRSPRFLPCHHTFCLHCLEGLVKACGPRLACPACRKMFTVPPGGVKQFTRNFYFSDEELERERNAGARAMCPTHPMEELIYFCRKCDLSICSRCKNTKHEGHHGTVDLFEEAAMRKGQLTATEEMLEHSIDRLMKQSTLAQDNLKASREKAVKLQELVHAQHSAIVARATELRDKVLEDLDRLTQEVEEDLSSDAQTVQEHLDNLMQLQQRIRYAVDNGNDAEVIALETEVKEGGWSVEALAQLEQSLPSTTQRPGLQSDAGSLKDEDLQLFIGSPVKLQMSNNVVALDSVTQVYRCGVDGSCREVHAMCKASEGLYVAFGGRAPVYNNESDTIAPQWNIKNFTDEETKNTGILIFERMKLHASTVHLANGGKLQLNGISNGSLQLKLSLGKKIGLIQRQNTDFDLVNHSKMRLIDIETVCAFDADIEGNLFVIVGEGEGSLDSDATGSSNKDNTDGQSSTRKRSVYLYRRHHKNPVATYTPPYKSFLTAVCFWKAEQSGCRLLLVTDSLNDSVHVVRVKNDQLHFVRYLAAGSGDLVRPTALDVDAEGYVWIGCENGLILQCEPGPDCLEREREREEVKEEEDDDDNDDYSDREWDEQSDSEQLPNADDVRA